MPQAKERKMTTGTAGAKKVKPGRIYSTHIPRSDDVQTRSNQMGLTAEGIQFRV